MKQKIFGFFICLLTLSVSIEHKYDKLFRHFSLTLIPQGLDLPRWFEKRIYFYPSDVLAFLLFALALYVYRIPLKQMLFEKKGGWLAALFGLAVLSIGFSFLSSYPVAYFRLIQLLTPILVFLVMAQVGRDWIRPIFWCFFAAGIFQAGLAIYQYFSQCSLGLSLLGELKDLRFAGHVPCPHGARWIVDWLFGIDVGKELLSRAAGTLPHSNILGGFLLASVFSGFALFCKAGKKLQIFIGSYLPFFIFSIFLTYSRSALFGGLLGGFLFFYRAKAPRILVWIAALSVLGSFSLLVDQILERGGVVNISPTSKESDQIRIAQHSVAVRMITTHPWLGVGYRQYASAPEFHSYDHKEALTLVHNSALMLACEVGLPALACFLFFLWGIARAAFSAAPTPEATAFLALVLAYCFIANCDFYPIYFQQGKLLFFLASGGLMACLPESRTQSFWRIPLATSSWRKRSEEVK